MPKPETIYSLQLTRLQPEVFELAIATRISASRFERDQSSYRTVRLLNKIRVCPGSDKR